MKRIVDNSDESVEKFNENKIAIANNMLFYIIEFFTLFLVFSK
jgi:hypothetical protein